MPTYEYVCQSCAARFEAWQKITDDPIDICPTCGEHVRRIIFPVGLVFKGSGFYVNDTRSSTSSSLPGGDASSSPESKNGEASGQDTQASESKSSASTESSGSAPSTGGAGSNKPKTSNTGTPTATSTSGE